MEYFIKTEPLEMIESSQECILCEDGKKYYNLLIQHFQKHHKDYNVYEDGPILQNCRCQESVQFQIQLITHILSHSVLNLDVRENENENLIKEGQDDDVVESYEEEYLNEEVEEEDYDRFVQSDRSENDDDLRDEIEYEEERQELQSSAKKRGRKRKNSSSGYKEKREKNLTCKVCLKEFDNPKKFYNHTAAAHREKFRCDVCNVHYNFKYQLRKHIETAHLDRPRVRVNRPKRFVCDICSLQFSELRILIEHKNIHLNIRPFVCEFCSEAFHNSANLRYHRKRHLNPDGFKCSVCFENFVNQQSLRKHHIRQHIEVDLDPHRFVCEYPDCGSSFKYEDLLKQHVRKIHHRVLGEYTCEICNFVTNNKQNYFQHRRRLHDIRNRKGNRVFPSQTMPSNQANTSSSEQDFIQESSMKQESDASTGTMNYLIPTTEMYRKQKFDKI